MDKGRIREHARKHNHTLVRVDGSGEEEIVAAFATFAEGWAEGQRLTHAQPDHAFRLYEGKRSVARFGFHRLQQQDATANLDTLVL